MDVPHSEVGYTSATTERGDHGVYKGHVVALARKKSIAPSVDGRTLSADVTLGRLSTLEQVSTAIV
jgi:hypothetical protein